MSSILRLFLLCGQEISPGFSGILNFSRRFLKEAAGLLFPLTEALEEKRQMLSWTLEMKQAFAD